MRYNLLIVLLLFCGYLSAQNSNLYRYLGKVYDKKTGLGIEGVTVFTIDSVYSVISGKSGKFAIMAPKNNGPLIFYKDSYKWYHLDTKSHNTIHRVHLERLNVDTTKLVFPKNTIVYYPVKLILGAISASYYGSIKNNFSGGINIKYYYKGRQLFGSEEFTGVKVSPTVRYFIKRNCSYGFYAEGKIIVGYFDFTRLNYTYSNKITVNFPTTFWTGGVGASVGIMDVLGDLKHVVLDLSIGVQIFPSNYPTEKTGEHGNELSHNSLWWIAGGPGSLIEINLGIGGIF